MTPSSHTHPEPDELAAALPEPLAGAVADDVATVTPYPVPGLPEGAVWQVRLDDEMHPQQSYVGRWPDGGVRVLSDDQPAFLDLAAESGARLDTEETALGYLRAFLEVTRGPMVRVAVIDDVDAIGWRPGAPDEEEQRRAVLTDERLAPPSSEPTPRGFRVDMCLVVDQRIQRNSFEVTPQGQVEASYVVLGERLPLPIVR